MVSLLKERIEMQNRERMAPLIIVDYYEALKELMTGLLLMDGFKTLNHQTLIEYVGEFTEMRGYEVTLLDELRIMRNRVSYDGFSADPSYLVRREGDFKAIMGKLKGLVEKRFNSGH